MCEISIKFANPLTIIQAPTPPPSQAGVFIATRFSNGFTVKGMVPMSYQLPDNMQVQVQISYTDAKGHPATIDGDVTWDTSDAEICGVESSGDSTLVTLIPGSKLGNAQISATADADLGEGVRNLVTTLDVSVIGGEAVAGTIAPVGPPEPIPEG